MARRATHAAACSSAAGPIATAGKAWARRLKSTEASPIARCSATCTLHRHHELAHVLAVLLVREGGLDEALVVLEQRRLPAAEGLEGPDDQRRRAVQRPALVRLDLFSLRLGIHHSESDCPLAVFRWPHLRVGLPPGSGSRCIQGLGGRAQSKGRMGERLGGRLVHTPDIVQLDDALTRSDWWSRQ